MLPNPAEIVPDALQVGELGAVATFIVSRLRRPREHERAALLAQLAHDAAALAAATDPGADANRLVQTVANDLGMIRTCPTKNLRAIRRAAAGAVLDVLARRPQPAPHAAGGDRVP